MEKNEIYKGALITICSLGIAYGTYTLIGNSKKELSPASPQNISNYLYLGICLAGFKKGLESKI